MTYAASKAFINTFTQTLVQELEGTGVRIQALCPGLVRTEFHDALGGRPPGVPVIEPDDIVRASLAGLTLGEVICAPTLPDASAIKGLSRPNWRCLARAAHLLWPSATEPPSHAEGAGPSRRDGELGAQPPTQQEPRPSLCLSHHWCQREETYTASATIKLPGPASGLRSSFRQPVSWSHSSASASL